MFKPIVDELSKEKGDLEAALRDVLRAMRNNRETAPSEAAIDISRLERLAKVSAYHLFDYFLFDLFRMCKTIMIMK